jgi:DNA-directed RNA polymerase sigma subunit (sigma70/sigma32)
MRIRAKILIKNYELEERRLAKGYTQADMAEIVGIQITRYAKLENIKAKPSEEEAMNIAIELGVNVNILFPQGYDKVVNVLSQYTDVINDYSMPMISGQDDVYLLEATDAQMTVNKLLKHAHLSKKEMEVVKLSNGLEDKKSRTLEEVGKEIGVTRERVRQIQAKAYEKIRQTAKYIPELGLKDKHNWSY